MTTTLITGNTYPVKEQIRVGMFQTIKRRLLARLWLERDRLPINRVGRSVVNATAQATPGSHQVRKSTRTKTDVAKMRLAVAVARKRA
jgi:hypothetical protein